MHKYVRLLSVVSVLAAVAFLSAPAPTMAQGAMFFGQNVGASNGSFSFVQKSSNAASVSSSPISLSLPSTGAGHTIVVYAFVHAGSAGSFAVNDGVNTYVAATTVCQNGVNTEEAFYVLHGAGGSLTISVSWSGTADWLFGNAREYSSTTAVTFESIACTTSPGSTTSPASDSLSVSGTNNLLVGGMIDFNASSGGCGSGWGNCSSNTNQSSAGPAETEDKLNQGSGNYSSTFTLGSAQSDWTAETVAFKD